MIEIKNLTICRGDRIILENLNITLEAGILCVLGKNGIGKTTFLKTISGLHKNYSGIIKINGKTLETYKQKEFATVVTLVPQEHIPYFKFKVREMIMMGRSPYITNLGFPKKIDFEIIDSVIETIGIQHLENKYFSELSGGEKKLVLIAMSLAQDTPIILLDEPTTSLDLKNTYDIISRIKNLSKVNEKLIIVSIHDINQAMSFGDLFLLLYSSSQYDFGTSISVVNETSLNRLFNLEFKKMNWNNYISFIPIV